MSWHVRPARADDLDALTALAELTGGGFTNLPRDRGALAHRLDWSLASFGRQVTAPDNEFYLLLLANRLTGEVGGTAMLFSRLGAEWPFYSYKLASNTQLSRELNRTFTQEVLYLVNDFNGASEIGGLFLRPDLRATGLGTLLARSRYLFIREHRERFADRVIAELRGSQTPAGDSPFWDGLGRLFFGMPFQEADNFNAIHGNQFIADLMPKHPIYVAMLPEAARAVIGQPHDSGRAALKMLEAEGFQYDGYVDIFDAGPTVCARTDSLRTLRKSSTHPLAALAKDDGALPHGLFAAGRLSDFTAWIGHGLADANGLTVPRREAELHNLTMGAMIHHVAL